MPELGSYGSVRGARGNSRPYRESDRRTVKMTRLTHCRSPLAEHRCIGVAPKRNLSRKCFCRGTGGQPPYLQWPRRSWAVQRLACNACERQAGAASDLFRRVDRFGRAVDRSGPRAANSVAVSMGRSSKPPATAALTPALTKKLLET
jgi:hypothetical protein